MYFSRALLIIIFHHGGDLIVRRLAILKPMDSFKSSIEKKSCRYGHAYINFYFNVISFGFNSLQDVPMYKTFVNKMSER